MDSSTLIKMAAFREELEKNATFWSTLKEFASSEPVKYMGAGAAVGTVASAIHEGIKKLEGMYDNYKLSHEKMPAFQAMLAMHPTLKENESRAKLYFDALWHFDPNYAQEPLSAGAYIRQALNMDHVAGGPLPEMVDKTVQIAKAYNDANKGGKDEGTVGTIFMPIKTIGQDISKSYVDPGLKHMAFTNLSRPNPVPPNYKAPEFKDRFRPGKD